MKRTKFFTLILLLVGACFLQACLTEEPEFPVQEEEGDIVVSLALQALFNNYKEPFTNSATDRFCFEFVYPIDLTYNTGITITINEREGLQETFNNDVSGLHVVGISYPVVVTKGDDLKILEEESDFLDLLHECELISFHDYFFSTYAQCYEFDYPFTMLTDDSTEVQIGSSESLFAFKRQQEDDYQPKFIFPLTGEFYPEQQSLEINNYFDIFQVLNLCEGCPELFFESRKIINGRYEFEVPIAFAEQVDTYEWLINGDVVEIDGFGVDGDNELLETFEPEGTFEVCVKAITDQCRLGTQYCTTFVSDPCPDLSFTSKIIEDGRVYEFEADFELRDEIEYFWTVFIQDDLILFEGEEPGGDNKFFFQFGEPGTYQVCIEYEGEVCGFTRYCEDVVIEQN